MNSAKMKVDRNIKEECLKCDRSDESPLKKKRTIKTYIGIEIR